MVIIGFNFFRVLTAPFNNSKSYEMYELKNKTFDKEQFIIGYQIGGMNYPLHHIMMSKGKSVIITPLLALHFALIYNKTVFIIVPYHLKPSTIERFNNITYIFNCEEKIKIFSDNEIKLEYLNGRFKSNKEYVMIIDEFDSLIDPNKSNFNITSNKIKFEDELCDFIKEIVIHIKDKESKLKISDICLSEKIQSKYSKYYNPSKI